MSTETIGEERLSESMGCMVGNMAGAVTCFSTWLGDGPGLFGAVVLPRGLSPVPAEKRIPTLCGAEDKLAAGARVAEGGCGHDTWVVAMAAR